MTTTETKELLLIAPLEPVGQGRVLEHVPPHVTVLPWFQLPTKNWKEFDWEMQELATEESFRKVRAACWDKFGPDQDVDVMLLSGIMYAAYARAWAVTESLGGVTDLTYAGLDWVPHITKKPGLELAEGQEIELEGLALLARGEDGHKKVEAVYEFAS